MTADDWARLGYLALLATALAGWFMAQARANLSRTLQQAAVWALIFLGVIAVAGLWGDIRRSVLPAQAVVTDSGQIMLPRGPDGHFHLTVAVNGVAIGFIVDTGATDLVLNRADAVRAGFAEADLAFVGRARTANGEVRTAPVVIDRLEVGGIVDLGVRASVNEGDMAGSLLGMSYLSRYSRIEIAGNQLVLTR